MLLGTLFDDYIVLIIMTNFRKSKNFYFFYHYLALVRVQARIALILGFKYQHAHTISNLMNSYKPS